MGPGDEDIRWMKQGARRSVEVYQGILSIHDGCGTCI